MRERDRESARASVPLVVLQVLVLICMAASCWMTMLRLYSYVPEHEVINAGTRGGRLTSRKNQTPREGGRERERDRERRRKRQRVNMGGLERENERGRNELEEWWGRQRYRDKEGEK